MAKSPGVTTQPRTPAPAVRTPGGAKPAVVTSNTAVAAPKKKVTPAQFLQEVRTEARKITWTSWKETWITSVMVGIMVVVTAVFFLVVDWGLGLFIQQILKLAV